MEIEYQGNMISIYRLAQISGCSLSTLYKAYHRGIRSGQALIEDANRNLVEYKGELMSIHRLCTLTNTNYKKVLRRIRGGMPVDEALSDKVDRRGARKTAKLTPSMVMEIYTALFWKEKTQSVLAKEYDVHQATISHIWCHRWWDWLTAPLRYDLEKERDSQNSTEYLELVQLPM